MRSTLLFITTLVLAGQLRAEDDHMAGLGVLASSIGHDAKVDDLAAFVDAGRFRRVLVDWAWITAHWDRTDFAAVQDFASRMKKAGVEVTAMYRPRFFEHDRLDIPFQVDAAGQPVAHGREICFSSEKARAWGAKWAAEILRKCPAFDEVVVYNPRNTCACAACAKADALGATRGFLEEVRAGMRKVNTGAKLGAVYNAVPAWFAAMKDAVDVPHPYLFVNGGADFAADMDAAREVLDAARQPGAALAKLTWGPDDRVTDARLEEFVKLARERKIPYWIWTYDDAFLNGTYDLERLCRALGVPPAPLAALVPKLGGRLRGPADPGTGLPGGWIESFPWEPTIESALARAKKENRMVVAFAIPFEAEIFEAGYEGADKVANARPLPAGQTRAGIAKGETGFAKERAILTALLGDPRLASLVLRRFVPVRLRLFQWHFFAKGGYWAPDPLERLGTTRAKTRAPAILVAAPDGTFVHAVSHMGVFSPDLTHRTLRALLAAHPEWNAPDGAVERAREALAAKPADAGLRRALVEALVAGGDFDAARQFLDRPAKLVPEWDPVLRGEMLRLEGDTAAAEKMLEAAPPSTPRAALLGDLLLRTGRASEAADLLAGALAKGGADPRAEYVLACALDRLGKRADAVARWDALVKNNPASPWADRAALRSSPNGPFLEEWESDEPLAADPLAPGTETGPGKTDPAAGAADYLVAQQRPDGMWRDPFINPAFTTAPPPTWGSAVPRTALAVCALKSAIPRLDKARAARAKEAVRLGTDFVTAWSARPSDEAWPLTYALHLELRLHAESKGADKTQSAARARKLLEALGRIEQDGGWTYAGAGRLHTFNTAPILILLTEAKAQGLDPDSKMIARAAAFLEKNRVGDLAVFHYGTKMEHLCSEENRHSSSMRSPLCELALHSAGAEKNAKRIPEALDLFFAHLDDVRATTKIYESWFDATVLHDAYHYYFGCWYAARALRAAGGLKMKPLAEKLRAAILATREVDGSFVDAQMVGKSSSTALALLALGELAEVLK